MSSSVNKKDHNYLLDRRKNEIMADLVDVGLLYCRIYGLDLGIRYFEQTSVAPHVFERVISGSYRRTQKPDRSDDLAFG